MSQTDCFWHRLETWAERPALISGDCAEVSYRALAAKADRWAAAAGEQFRSGKARPALVAIAIEPAVDIIAAYLGALRAGHAVMLVEADTLAAGHPLRETYRPNLLVRMAGGICLTEAGDPEPADLGPDLAVLLSTSGTTGAPKLVRLSGANIEANARSIAEYLAIGPDARAITTLPLHYSYGMSVLHSHLASGASLVLTEFSLTTDAFWHAFQTHGATSLALVPHQVDLLLARDFERMPLPSLRYVTQAGGRLAPEKVRRLAEIGQRAGWDFYVMYGQTEAAPRMAYLPPEDAVDHGDTIGKAIPGGRLWLAGPDGREIERDGESGEIYYEGPNVMLGYAETREELALGDETPALATGDIAVRTAKGYFRIIGRKKRFVKLYGLRLGLDEMEARLVSAGHQGYCVSVDDRLVVLHEAPGAAEAIRSILAEAFDLPLDAVATRHLTDVPLLSSGKPDYAALNRLAETPEPGHAPDLSADGASRQSSVRAAVASATRTATLSGTDTFNSVGGDSLAYLHVSMALEDHLGTLPEGWEDMQIADLEALVPTSETRGLLTADVFTRIVAVALIVINHGVVTWPVGGGSWILLIIVGYSLARFASHGIARGESLRTLVKLLYPFLPLYFLILAAVAISGRYVDPAMIFLVANLGEEGQGFLVSPNWFVSLYVQVLLIAVATLSIPAITRRMVSDPWVLGLHALGICLVASAMFQLYVQPLHDAGASKSELVFIIRSPLVCLPFVALGWMIFNATTPWKAWLTAAAVVVTAALFPGWTWLQCAIIGTGGLVLLSDFALRVPRWLSTMLRAAAGSTLFVYLLHGLPVHLFRHATDWSAELGTPLTALGVTVLSFGLGYLARRGFEFVDATYLYLRRRALAAAAPTGPAR